MRKVISKKLIIICVCTLALFFVGINSVNTVSADSPTTYYVATTGSDENPGTFEKPFLTIGKAATVVVPGDTVYIRGGTYYEQVTLTTSGSQNKPITWEGYGNETVIIDGINRPVKLPCPIYEKPQIYLKSCDWQILRKLTVVNSPS
jgi:hypothetical protein